MFKLMLNICFKSHPQYCFAMTLIDVNKGKYLLKFKNTSNIFIINYISQ